MEGKCFFYILQAKHSKADPPPPAPKKVREPQNQTHQLINSPSFTKSQKEK